MGEFVAAVREIVDNDGGTQLPKGLKVTALIYQEVLRGVVKP